MPDSTKRRPTKEAPTTRKVVKRKTRQPKHKEPSRGTYRAGFSWPYFGVHYGDDLIVIEDGQAKIGQLVYIRGGGESDDEYLARVCDLKDEAIRVCSNQAHHESYDEPRSLIVGAVVSINHAHCNATKAAALRKQVLELQNGEDAYVYSARIAELETEIFNLEHQPDEEADEADDDWPDVIGEGSASHATSN